MKDNWLGPIRERFQEIARRRVESDSVERVVDEAVSVIHSKRNLSRRLGPGGQTIEVPSLAWYFQVLRDVIEDHLQQRQSRDRVVMKAAELAALSEEETRLLKGYFAGTLSAQEQQELEERVLRNFALAEALYAGEQGASKVGTRFIETARNRGKGGAATLLRIAIPIVAGALLIVMLPRFFRDEKLDEHALPQEEPERKPSPPVQPAPGAPNAPKVIGLFPFGTFSTPPPQFIWTRDSNATTYRFELLDESNQVLFWTETADTTVALPGDHSGWNGVASWRVFPLKNGTEGAPSEPVRVRIDPSTG